jgi:hypothetical protein
MNKPLSIISGTAIVALAASALIGCSSGSVSTNPPGGGTVPVSFSIKDNPPAGVTVLAFELEITGASLLPSNSSSQPVSLISHPDDVELEHLQTDSALLANVNVPAGTYGGASVTFATPQMTILNQTGSTLALGSQSCANNQVCEFSPTLNQTSVTVQAPAAPFPITLNANSPLALRMDFNVNASIQPADLSITPTVTLMQLPAPGVLGGDDHEDDMELVGRITATDATDQSFTLQSGLMGTSRTIATNSSTEFDFDNSCSAKNFSCLQTGQIVKVEVQLASDGTLTANEVRLFAPPSMFELRGTVTEINTATSSFQIVIFDDDDFGSQQMPNVSVGIPLTVDVSPQATFTVDSDGLMIPAGLSFSNLSQMMVGQAVRIHPTGLSVNGTPPNLAITLTADQVELVRSELTGTISAINASATPPMFTLGMLPPLFASASISSIQVDVLSTTEFESDDDAMMTVTGINNLATGNVVSVGGLLFNTTGTPTMVAEKIDLRH